MENSESQWYNSVWEPGQVRGVYLNLSLKARKPGMLMSEGRKGCICYFRERANSSLLCLCCVQVLTRLGDVHSRWGDHLLYQPGIQALISSGKTLAGTPRDNALQAFWTAFGPVKLTQKISHHLDVWIITDFTNLLVEMIWLRQFFFSYVKFMTGETHILYNKGHFYYSTIANTTRYSL